jgi:hypothetical protein
LASIIAYYQQISGVKGFATDDQSCMKQSIRKWIAIFEQVCSQTMADLAKLPAKIQQLEGPGWTLPLSTLTDWGKHAGGQTLQILKKICVADVLESLCALTNDVQSKTPGWDHIFPNHMFVRNKAKKELLGHPHREALSPMARRLFHAIASLTASWGNLALPETAAEHEFTKEQIAVSQLVFESAKKAVAITAHCHVILGLQGPDQKTEAKKLLSKPRDVPSILITELQAIAGAQAAVSVPAKAAKNRKG